MYPVTMAEANQRRIEACLVACKDVSTDELESDGIMGPVRFLMTEQQAENAELCRLLRLCLDSLRDDRNSEALAIMIRAYLSHAKSASVDIPLHRRDWTMLEDGSLAKLAGRMSTSQIADVMGRTVSSVQQRAHVLGVSLALPRTRRLSPSTSKPKVVISKVARVAIRGLMAEGMTAPAIAEQLDLALVAVERAMEQEQARKAREAERVAARAERRKPRAIEKPKKPEQPAPARDNQESLARVRSMAKAGVWNLPMGSRTA